MLKERGIRDEWVWSTINFPDHLQAEADDGNRHYTKAIPERDNRVLHVVVNQRTDPHRIVTMFFDRRLRKRK
jgi:hypothetical protein